MRMFLIIGLALSACSTAAPHLSPAPQATVRRPNLPAAPPDSRIWYSRVPTASTITYLPAPPAGREPLADVLGAPAILSPAGYSRIRIGAKLVEVEGRYALDTAMEKDFDDRCRLYWTPYVPGLTVYVENGVVTRVSIHHVRLAAEVWVPPAVRTDRGIGIDSSEAEVRAAYSPLEERSRRGPGADLYFGGTKTTPGLRFEFDRDRMVSEISAGTMPALALSEGCL